MNLYEIKKFVEASSLEEAIKKERKTAVDAVVCIEECTEEVTNKQYGFNRR